MYLRMNLNMLNLLALLMILVFFKQTSCDFPASCTTRVVGGYTVDIEEAPYMVSLLFNGKQHCGGVILNENTVLTTAHCVIDYSSKNLIIRSGSSIATEGGVIYKVLRRKVHKDFDENTVSSDIAILKVEKITFNNATQPVTLPTSDCSSNDTLGLITGWGRIQANGRPSRKLRCALLPKVSREECEENYQDVLQIMKDMLCYGYESGEKDSCTGDSGGPLVNENKTLIGIVSWGNGCAERNKPGIYADACFFLEWIQTWMQKYAS